MTDLTVTIPAPVVPYKAARDTDATMMRGAANRLACGYKVGGSNVTRTVELLLRDVADALEGRPVGERSSEPVPCPTISLDDLIGMTYDQRQALPATHHRPYFDGQGEPNSWICSVCWDDGVTHQWPCAQAVAGGAELADALGLGFAR